MVERHLAKVNVASSNLVFRSRKAEPKRYNVDLVSNREGLRVFRKPFFVVDYRRYSLLFGVIRTMTARKNQRDKKRYRQDLNLRHIS